MKLTLSVGGGATGLVKECSIDISSLDENTHQALMTYMDTVVRHKPAGFNETWSLNDEKEVPIDKDKMNRELQQLYRTMKQNLQYRH